MHYDREAQQFNKSMSNSMQDGYWLSIHTSMKEALLPTEHKLSAIIIDANRSL